MVKELENEIESSRKVVFSSGKARLFFTFGALGKGFVFSLLPVFIFVSVLCYFGCLVFVISVFFCLWIFRHFVLTIIKMLMNLYMICGSFDMDTVICRSFVFSFRYSAQRFTLRFILYRFHSSLFALFLVLISFFNPTRFSLIASMVLDTCKLISVNVRGINNFRKRRTIFTWCRKQKADLIFLQQTHSNKNSERQWKNECGGDMIMSHGSSDSCGVPILFKKGLIALCFVKIRGPTGALFDPEGGDRGQIVCAD